MFGHRLYNYNLWFGFFPIIYNGDRSDCRSLWQCGPLSLEGCARMLRGDGENSRSTEKKVGAGPARCMVGAVRFDRMIRTNREV